MLCQQNIAIIAADDFYSRTNEDAYACERQSVESEAMDQRVMPVPQSLRASRRRTFQTSSLINLQATKLFIVAPATKGWVVTTPPGFRVRFNILYRVIQPLIQHCLVHNMVYLNIIYVIATRNYEFFTTGIFP